MTNNQTTLILTNATLIDCVKMEPVVDTSVVIENGLISEVMRGSPRNSEGIRVIDLAGAYLLPGLWDVHVHPEYPPIPNQTVPEQTLRFGSLLTQALSAGITGVRCAGTAYAMDIALKKAVEEKQFLGPRIVAGGEFLTTTGGHYINSNQTRQCDGPYGFVKAIREQIMAGADQIMLNLTGGITGPIWDRHADSFLLLEEMEAAFAICRQRGYKVIAHATTPEAVKTAIRLGAHSIEHGYMMDDECIDLFVEYGTWYVPTLAISHLTPDRATTTQEKDWLERRNLPLETIKRANDAAKEHGHWFSRALNAGVKMALGSDRQPLHQTTFLEMGMWIKAGATPENTILAATRNAAEICGFGDKLGTIEPGKFADLIVVGNNPLEQIESLRDLRLVLKNGVVITDNLL